VSAVLVDELLAPTRVLLRQARASELAAQGSTGAVVRELRPATAPGFRNAGVPTQPSASKSGAQSASWRLTERGIAVVLTLFVGLFLTGVVVAITSFLAISDAPVVNPPAAVAAVFDVGR